MSSRCRSARPARCRVVAARPAAPSLRARCPGSRGPRPTRGSRPRVRRPEQPAVLERRRRRVREPDRRAARALICGRRIHLVGAAPRLRPQHAERRRLRRRHRGAGRATRWPLDDAALLPLDVRLRLTRERPSSASARFDDPRLRQLTDRRPARSATTTRTRRRRMRSRRRAASATSSAITRLRRLRQPSPPARIVERSPMATSTSRSCGDRSPATSRARSNRAARDRAGAAPPDGSRFAVRLRHRDGRPARRRDVSRRARRARSSAAPRSTRSSTSTACRASTRRAAVTCSIAALLSPAAQWLLRCSARCEREERHSRSLRPAPALAATIAERLAARAASRATSANTLRRQCLRDLAKGKRLFGWYNCTGCHSNGGGGMGPPLMDDEWIYGSSAAEDLRHDRRRTAERDAVVPRKIPDDQIWQLVAYVRSLSGPRQGRAPARTIT